MDNQQGKNPELQAAWLAGFMDGEGSFCLRKNNGGWKYPQPLVTVTNTHKPTIDHTIEVLNFLGLAHHIQYREKASSLSKLPSWQISVTGPKRCKRWCETLLPYLVTKQVKADALLEWCIERLDQPLRGSGMSLRQQSLFEVIRFGSQPSQTTRGTELITLEKV
ncbi:MAG: hypothetical protein NVS9B15_26420 [Acidobacteriaceae bacterium]